MQKLSSQTMKKCTLNWDMTEDINPSRAATSPLKQAAAGMC